MSFKTLTERERTILSLIVQSYIHDCSPVGSRTLVRRFGLDLSPAMLEVARNRGSAAEALGVGPGDVVTWRRPPRK